MALTRKVLWIVNMNTDASETTFAKYALASGANTVCIRTISKRVLGAIARFKDLGMSVYAWPWPSVVPTRTRTKADLVAKELIPAGVDGYTVDPESDGPGPNDWNQDGLDDLAADSAARSGPRRGASLLSSERRRDAPIHVHAKTRHPMGSFLFGKRYRATANLFAVDQ
jgi:hypothetical protein